MLHIIKPHQWDGSPVTSHTEMGRSKLLLGSLGNKDDHDRETQVINQVIRLEQSSTSYSRQREQIGVYWPRWHQLRTPTAQLAPITGWIWNKKKCPALDVGGKPQWGTTHQLSRDWQPKPHARLWSEVGLEPGSHRDNHTTVLYSTHIYQTWYSRRWVYTTFQKVM